jgi:hypothetical protein
MPRDNSFFINELPDFPAELLEHYTPEQLARAQSTARVLAHDGCAEIERCSDERWLAGFDQPSLVLLKLVLHELQRRNGPLVRAGKRTTSS